jgi:protein-S-isoprenylcysteine O-methyltransferase Ste14
MVGFLFQCPSVITLVMFPILVYMYMRLAQRQEQDSLAQFGEAYLGYMQRVPAFVPRRTSTNNQRELEA